MELLLEGIKLVLELVKGGKLGLVGGRIFHRIELCLDRVKLLEKICGYLAGD